MHHVINAINGGASSTAKLPSVNGASTGCPLDRCAIAQQHADPGEDSIRRCGLDQTRSEELFCIFLLSSSRCQSSASDG